MVTIKFFGLIRESSGQYQLCVDAKTVREAINKAVCAGVDRNLMRGALMFVNGTKLTGAGRFRCRMHDGDELAMLSPAGGG